MKIHIDAAFKSINKNNEELCGDKVQIMRTENSTIAVLADGLGQLRQGLLVKMFSGLVQAGLHLGDGEVHGAPGLGLEGGISQQGVQPSS